MTSPEIGEIVQLLREIKGELAALSKSNVPEVAVQRGPHPQPEPEVKAAIESNPADKAEKQASSLAVESESASEHIVNLWEIIFLSQECLEAPLPKSPEISPSCYELPELNSLEGDEESLHQLHSVSLQSYMPSYKSQHPVLEYIPTFSTHLPEDISRYLHTLSQAAGDPWKIPSDGRVQLQLSSTGLGVDRDVLETQPAAVFIGSDFQKQVKGKLSSLLAFDKSMRGMKDCFFALLDFDPWTGGMLTYRLGEDRACETGVSVSGFLTEFGSYFGWKIEWGEQKTRPMKYPNLTPVFNLVFTNCASAKEFSPWCRLIVCKGLAAMPRQSFSRGTRSRGLFCPYFSESESTLHHAFNMHLNCSKNKGNKINQPYHHVWGSITFHITFYEKTGFRRRATAKQSNWKSGKLVGAGNRNIDLKGVSGGFIQQSAFTLYMPTAETRWEGPFTPFFTIVCMIPESSQTLADELFTGRERSGCRIGAEICCISICLELVATKWTVLDEHFEQLLGADFVDSKEYVKLLFDDENFTSSQKYFWSIGCLTEFIANISDNILQWDLYYEARILLLEKDPRLTERFRAANVRKPSDQDKDSNFNFFKNYLKRAKIAREALVDLKASFSGKLETTKALRDGLFNASALVESRTSTKLGQNVKLLTYVSIFYLPLAFCASLWAIPNILEQGTKVAFIATAVAVGVVTYGIVFNLNNLSDKVSKTYRKQREHILKRMMDDSESWQERAKRFEEFKPSNERKVPSEWWILIYSLRRLGAGIFWWRKRRSKREIPA